MQCYVSINTVGCTTQIYEYDKKKGTRHSNIPAGINLCGKLIIHMFYRTMDGGMCAEVAEVLVGIMESH